MSGGGTETLSGSLKRSVLQTSSRSFAIARLIRILYHDGLQLRLRYPEEEIRSLPAKDKSTSTLAPSPPSQSNPASPQPQSTRAYLASWIPGNGSPLRTATEGNSASAELAQHTEDDLASVANMSAPLTREKNRLTLRSFLRSFLLNSTLASSPVLRSFLLSGPQTLSPSEQADARRREDADRVRDEGRKRFKLEAGKRVEELRESVKDLREEVIQSKGVRRVFEILKEVELVEDLPEEYRKVLEYGKISYVTAPPFSRPRLAVSLTTEYLLVMTQTRSSDLPDVCCLGRRLIDLHAAQAASRSHAVLRPQGDPEDLEPDGHDPRCVPPPLGQNSTPCLTCTAFLYRCARTLPGEALWRTELDPEVRPLATLVFGLC